MLTAAHCGPKVDYVRVGEWRVVDTSTFNEENCAYYNKKTEKLCNEDPRGPISSCKGYCYEEDGKVDCIDDNGGYCEKNSCEKEGRLNRCSDEYQVLVIFRLLILINH